MKNDDALARLANHNGIFPEFKDMAGVIHRASPDTQRAMLRANGLEISTARDVQDHLRQYEQTRKSSYVANDVVVSSGVKNSVPVGDAVEWQVLSESDGVVLAEGHAEEIVDLPALPDGVHSLRVTGSKGTQLVNLIAAPVRAPSLKERSGMDQVWGVTAAFYGLNSGTGKKLADFDDLAAFSRILGINGAGFLGINPVHSLGEAAEDTISPYSPVHRGFLNTDHIALAERQPSSEVPTKIDYQGHRKEQRSRLRDKFSAFKASGNDASRRAFNDFCQNGGTALRDFARFEALSMHHGPNARHWPANAFEHHSASEDEMDYFMWMQWQADQQLGAAQEAAKSSGMTLGLYLDLAVGARLGGAESWGTQSAAAHGVSLGAPPDHLSPAGQNWQLSALSPRRLQHGKYEAFRFVLRQNMRHAGVLRIDHALGLNRSFWLPEDGSPGGYIRQHFQSFMGIIAIEAKRAGTVIVGEDLGLVPDGFRDEMAAWGLYGYSVLQYEKDAGGDFLPAHKMRAQSLACFGTHDTPTLEGFWRARDIAWWEKLGWITPQDATCETVRRSNEKRQLARLPAPAPLPFRAGAGVRDTVHANLAACPAALVAVQLDDILCLEEAQNLPGTVDEHPNWRRVYPSTFSEIETGPDLHKTAGIMAHTGRSSKTRREKT